MADLTDERARELDGLIHARMRNHTAACGHAAAKRLREAGWTVEPPPEPRYYVEQDSTDGRYHFVRDRRNAGMNVAWFFDRSDFAREHCARLNAEHGGGS